MSFWARVSHIVTEAALAGIANTLVISYGFVIGSGFFIGATKVMKYTMDNK